MSSGASAATTEVVVCGADARGLRRPTDDELNATLTDARRRVSAAVDRTRDSLRDRSAAPGRSGEHLLRLVRYPPRHALNLARSAEIFEQTMEALLADVGHGHAYNISDAGQLSTRIQQQQQQRRPFNGL